MINNNFKKCLVLGANGFIGRSLIKDLISKFEIVETFSLDVSKDIIFDGVDNIIGDYFNEAQLRKSLFNVDVVIHLITTMTPILSNKNPALDVKENLLAGVNFLDICTQMNVKKIIYLSSGGTVYGDLSSVKMAVETDCTNPNCSYGITKLALENYLCLYNQLYGIDVSILRVSNPYGPLQSFYNAQGVIASFIGSIKLKTDLNIWGNGNAIRDFIFIDDLNDAIIKAIFYNGKFKIFNVGSAFGVSINELVLYLNDILSTTLNVTYVNKQNEGISKIVLNNDLAFREMNWKPQHDIISGLNKTLLAHDLL